MSESSKIKIVEGASYVWTSEVEGVTVVPLGEGDGQPQWRASHVDWKNRLLYLPKGRWCRLTCTDGAAWVAGKPYNTVRHGGSSPARIEEGETLWVKLCHRGSPEAFAVFRVSKTAPRSLGATA